MPQKPKFDPDLLAKIQFDDTTLQSSYAVLEVPCLLLSFESTCNLKSMDEAMGLLENYCKNLNSEKTFSFNRRLGLILEGRKHAQGQIRNFKIAQRLCSVPNL